MPTFSHIAATTASAASAVGSVLAAAIISQQPDGSLLHFERIGYVVVATTLVTLAAMYFVQEEVAERAGRSVV